MEKEIKMPQLSESSDSGTVVNLLVSSGDTVEKDQPIAELELDKAVAELPSEFAGTVKKIHIKEGDEVKVGQSIITLEDEDSGGKPARDASSTEQETQGQEEDRDQSAETEAESDEPQEPETAPEESAPEQPSQQEDRDQPPAAARSKQDAGPAQEKPQDTGSNEPVPAAPSVRRFAREIGVAIAEVNGSGPHGRISIDDVKQHAKTRAGSKPDSAQAVEKLPDFSRWGSTEREAMSKIRRLTAEKMAFAWSRIPQAVQFGKADISELERRAREYKKKAEAAGGHLSLTVILLKTVAGALKAFPRFNAALDANRKEIIYKKYTHIALAMDTERGLVVPVIRDVDRKGIVELAVELKHLTGKARDGKLSVDDMQGANITISNAGALGGDLFIPIVNWPQAAILGVAHARTEPVFEGGSFKPRQMLPLALSYDHRLNDGADGVRFVRWIAAALEDPVKLAWEG